jgi:ABC-type multidrug transport system ATPase subunit
VERGATPVAPRLTHALELTEVTRDHRFGFWLRRRTALAPTSLVLEDGAAIGLMGPNGSGKSTLLRLCAGVDRPSGGRVRVFGHDPLTNAGRAAVGFLTEGFPYPHELSGRSVLDLVARLRRLGATRRERLALVDRWLARVGLERDARRATGRWSTGMRRRLALACAFAHEPRLVLLDEPGAGLDADGFAVLDELLRESAARGAALVLCSHHGSELFAHTRRVCVLVHGRTAFDGPADELARRARRVELEIETGGSDVAAVLGASGARVVAQRPAAAATARLYAELARESETR